MAQRCCSIAAIAASVASGERAGQDGAPHLQPGEPHLALVGGEELEHDLNRVRGLQCAQREMQGSTPAILCKRLPLNRVIVAGRGFLTIKMQRSFLQPAPPFGKTAESASVGIRTART
jgi:hypothetical protein